MDIVRTKELFAPLIQRPTLTDQLLQRPPFKFLHDIVRETIQFTGYPSGLFSEDELDSQKAGSSRENKISFLQKLIDVLNVDGNLDNVKPAKIVAGKEPEMTNLLLQSLASEASTYMHERKKLDKKVTSTTKSKTSSKSSSSKLKDQKNDSTNNKEKTTKTQKPRSVEKEETGKKSSKNSSSQRKVSSKDKLTKENDKERRKKRTDSIKNDTAYLASPSQSNTQQQQISDIIFDNTSLPDSRRTPPDRESSGGTSKGDDSGIAEETGAESERHDISEIYGGPPFIDTTTAKSVPIRRVFPADITINIIHSINF
jgi:TRAF3-interacting protein 1